MKVILSVDPIKYPLTGIGRYTLELARNLATLPDIEELRYFGPANFVPALPDATAAEVQQPGAPVSAVKSLKRLLARNRLILETYRYVTGKQRENALAGLGDYVYHGPNFYLPAVEGPAVVTIHDISVFTMPECHPKERVMFMRKEVELALTRASLVVTISDHAAQEIARYFSWPREKIRTTLLASTGNFSARAPREIAPALDIYGLRPGAYSLYAGTIEPRKNLERLIEAYAGFAPALRARFPLVLAGYKGWNNEAIMERVRKGESEGWLKYLGYVPEEVLPQLFAGARLFVFPSLYEGFGLPVLEAMSSGVPVVCSNASSLPQVVGDAAAMCAPEDVEALRALIERGLEDDGWRDAAIARGIAQAKTFSWLRCAEETAAAYRSALDLAA